MKNKKGTKVEENVVDDIIITEEVTDVDTSYIDKEIENINDAFESIIFIPVEDEKKSGIEKRKDAKELNAKILKTFESALRGKDFTPIDKPKDFDIKKSFEEIIKKVDDITITKFLKVNVSKSLEDVFSSVFEDKDDSINSDILEDMIALINETKMGKIISLYKEGGIQEIVKNVFTEVGKEDFKTCVETIVTDLCKTSISETETNPTILKIEDKVGMRLVDFMKLDKAMYTPKFKEKIKGQIEKGKTDLDSMKISKSLEIGIGKSLFDILIESLSNPVDIENLVDSQFDERLDDMLEIMLDFVKSTKRDDDSKDDSKDKHDDEHAEKSICIIPEVCNSVSSSEDDEIRDGVKDRHYNIKTFNSLLDSTIHTMCDDLKRQIRGRSAYDVNKSIKDKVELIENSPFGIFINNSGVSIDGMFRGSLNNDFSSIEDIIKSVEGKSITMSKNIIFNNSDIFSRGMNNTVKIFNLYYELESCKSLNGRTNIIFDIICLLK